MTVEGALRSSGVTFLMRAECCAMSSLLKDKCTRLADGGCLSTDTPGRHSFAGRIGCGAKPPPQFGQTLCSLVSTQSAQNVHSKVQMRASVAFGGRSLSQYSQFGRSCSAMVISPRWSQNLNQFRRVGCHTLRPTSPLVGEVGSHRRCDPGEGLQSIG